MFQRKRNVDLKNILNHHIYVRNQSFFLLVWPKKTLSGLTLFDLRNRGSSSLEEEEQTRCALVVVNYKEDLWWSVYCKKNNIFPLCGEERNLPGQDMGAFSPKCWKKELIWVKGNHGQNETTLRCRDNGLCSYIFPHFDPMSVVAGTLDRWSHTVRRRGIFVAHFKIRVGVCLYHMLRSNHIAKEKGGGNNIDNPNFFWGLVRSTSLIVLVTIMTSCKTHWSHDLQIISDNTFVHLSSLHRILP